MRTTLALMLGMGAVLAAALWTARQVTPERVATTLNEIGVEADAAASELEEQAAVALDRIEEKLEPIVEEVLEELQPSPVREPLGAPEPLRAANAAGESAAAAEPAVVPPPSSPVVAAAPLPEAPPDLVVETEDFEDATTWDDSPDLAIEASEEEAPQATSVEDDPDASAARIRRMLSVYRRAVDASR